MTHRATARKQMHVGEIICCMNLEVKWKHFQKAFSAMCFWGLKRHSITETLKCLMSEKIKVSVNLKQWT